jgi:hypothetical protein
MIMGGRVLLRIGFRGKEHNSSRHHYGVWKNETSPSSSTRIRWMWSELDSRVLLQPLLSYKRDIDSFLSKCGGGDSATRKHHPQDSLLDQVKSTKRKHKS